MTDLIAWGFNRPIDKNTHQVPQLSIGSTPHLDLSRFTTNQYVPNPFAIKTSNGCNSVFGKEQSLRIKKPFRCFFVAI